MRTLAKRAWLCAIAAVTTVMLVGLVGCDPKQTAPIDPDPPELTILEPLEGDDVSGISFPLTIETSDDAIAAEVTVADEEAFTLATRPYSTLVLSLPYRGVEEGLQVKVAVFDAAGNSTVDSVTVFVNDLTYTQVTTAPQPDKNPFWSPDGSSIVFQSFREFGTFDLYTINRDGTGETRLTFNPQQDENPAWSPDGNWITWQSNRDGKWDVWRMPLATGEVDAENVTFPNQDNLEPQYTLDGNLILYASNRGTNSVDFYNIWAIDPETKATTQITAFTESSGQPTPSFDGQFAVFTSTLNVGRLEKNLYILPVGTDDVTLLTGEIAIQETDPHLSPLANLIVYGRQVDAIAQTWVIFSDRGNAVLLTPGGSILGDGGPVWSPDGKRVAFHSGVSGNFDIWIVE